jgi:hypothetical protein
MVLSELQHKFDHFQHLSLLDMEGNELANSWFNQELFDREAWPTFQDASGGRIAHSRVMVMDGIPVMFIAAPIFTNGTQSGVIWGRLNAKPIWDVVIQLKRDLNFGADGHIFLLDSRDTLIASDEISTQFGQAISLEKSPDSGKQIPGPG